MLLRCTSPHRAYIGKQRQKVRPLVSLCALRRHTGRAAAGILWKIVFVCGVAIDLHIVVRRPVCASFSPPAYKVSGLLTCGQHSRVASSASWEHSEHDRVKNFAVILTRHTHGTLTRQSRNSSHDAWTRCLAVGLVCDRSARRLFQRLGLRSPKTA